jgi:carboxyl-terminal processing protease
MTGRVFIFAARLVAPLGAALVLLGACATLPSANERKVPEVAAVADASPERLALNAEVYDRVVEAVSKQHYQREELGPHWLEQAAEERAEVIASPDEVGFYRGLNAVLAELGDKHTNAIRPFSNRLIRQRRLGEGLDFGFSLAGASGGYVVDRVRPDGPAAKAGIQPGWRVDTVDGEPFATTGSYIDGEHRWGFTDAEDQPRVATFAAVPLSREVGYVDRTPEGVLVITFNSFDGPSREWVQAQLAGALADSPTAIIIDLRGNGGGDAWELRRILSPFFTEPTAYGIVDSGPIFGGVRKTGRWRTPWTGPLAVLISGRTASAAELFAAAVQESGRGPVVGSKSAGAVVASRHFDLPDGGMLSIGIRSFRTAAGVTLEHRGVTPDVVTAPTLDELRQGRDPTLEAAVAALLAPNPTQEPVAEAAPSPEPA